MKFFAKLRGARSEQKPVAITPQRDIDHFAQALTGELRLAHADQIEGCSEEEIQEVLAQAQGFRLPAYYLAFLRRLGRQGGRVLVGTDFFYPAPVETSEAVKEFVERDEPTLRLSGRFFFASHQGYQFYFFDEALPGKVFMHIEGDSEPQLLTETFLEFLWNSARGSAGRARPDLPQFPR